MISLKNISICLRILFFCTASFASNLLAQELNKQDLELLKASGIQNSEIENFLNQSNNTTSAKSANDFSVDGSKDDFSVDGSKDDFSVDGSKGKTVNVNRSNIYGFDYIDSMPTSITATSDLPVPGEYSVSLGDSFSITITGSIEKTFKSEVSLNGMMVLPGIGEVQAVGETFDELKKKIRAVISSTYIGVETFISIESLKAKKINIIGAVKTPGMYLINPFSTISSALAYSGGLEDYASLRNIRLIRNGKYFDFDLYDLLIFGDRSNDIVIQQGDTLQINTTNNLVNIQGFVNRQYLYEFKPSDKFNDLISFAMGFSRDADKTNIYVSEKSKNEIITKKIALDSIIGNKDLRLFFVGSKLSNSNLDIKVTGSGVDETFLPHDKYQNIADIILDISFTDEIYPFYAELQQLSQDGKIQQKILFSLEDIETQDVEIKKNPVLKFYSRDEIFNKKYSFKEDVTKTIRQGNFSISLPLVGKFNPTKLINYFGASFNEFDQIKLSTYVDGTLTAYIDESRRFESKNISSIYLLGDETESSVKVEINGLVKNPGEYEVPYGTSLAEIYDLAGGFSKNADLDSIVLQRERIKKQEKQALDNASALILDLVINSYSSASNNNNSNDYSGLIPLISLANETEAVGRLTGDLSPESANSSFVIIENGDVINVQPRTRTITISGQVLQPATTTYEVGLTVDDYIQLAGGFTKYSDKKNIYILRKDGSSVPLNNVYFKPDIKLYAGDTIIVPRNLDKISALPLISTAAQIISNISFAAASLNSLQNN